MNQVAQKHRTVMLLVAVVVTFAGCRSAAPLARSTDAKVVRYSEAGAEAFSEGELDAAAKQYRKAVLRAWAIDDPSEAGVNAYNLAAVLVSQDENLLAVQWLVEARAELRRAGKSVGNTVLLEAKIARSEGRFSDAAVLIERAACATPPCGEGGERCQDEACRQSCLSRLPCVGSKVAAKEAVRDCQDDYAAQVELAKASLAAELYDVPCAVQHFHVACELADDVCSDSLQAELQHVAALIHLAKGESLHAAVHLDLEAVHLRQARNHREIPGTLELAAAAYEQSGRPDLAATRLLRVAHIHFARGDEPTAWRFVQRASTLAGDGFDSEIEIRLALIARQIERSLTDQGEAGHASEFAPIETVAVPAIAR